MKYIPETIILLIGCPVVWFGLTHDMIELVPDWVASWWFITLFLSFVFGAACWLWWLTREVE